MCAQFKYRTILSWNLIEEKDQICLLIFDYIEKFVLKVHPLRISSILSALAFPSTFLSAKNSLNKIRRSSEFYLSLKFTSSLVTPLLFFSFFLSNILFPLLLWSHFFHIPLQNLSFFQFLLSSSVCLPRLFLLCFTIPNSCLLLIFFFG